MPSRFFASFSLQDLIGNRFSTSGPHCGASGGSGSSSGFIGSGQSNYRKSESLSCPVHESNEGEFDEEELIESLRASVEQAILESGASINTGGDIPGNFNSSEFFLEYTDQGIHGRIIMSGNLFESSYRLRAEIEEQSEGKGPSFPVEAFSRIRPESNYYVVALGQGDPLAQENKIHYIGID